MWTSNGYERRGTESGRRVDVRGGSPAEVGFQLEVLCSLGTFIFRIMDSYRVICFIDPSATSIYAHAQRTQQNLQNFDSGS